MNEKDYHKAEVSPELDSIIRAKLKGEKELIEPAPVSAGELANLQARKGKFKAYRKLKASNTLKRQDACLRQFSDYLSQHHGMGDLNLLKPENWSGITSGLIEGFREHLLSEGYAVSSVNVRVYTLRQYAKLAYQSRVLDPAEFLQIQLIRHYTESEARHLDESRKEKQLETRKGTKKADPTYLTPDMVQKMMPKGDSPQAIRDRLFISLLSELGLRIGELHLLTRESFDLDNKRVKFFRPKVELTQTHNLYGSYKYLLEYLEENPEGEFWKGSNKSRELMGGWSVRSMKRRIQYLGRKAGIEQLSPHDLRHYWARMFVAPLKEGGKGKPIEILKRAGGWKTYAMPDHYMGETEIANE